MNFRGQHITETLLCPALLHPFLFIYLFAFLVNSMYVFNVKYIPSEIRFIWTRSISSHRKDIEKWSFFNAGTIRFPVKESLNLKFKIPKHDYG